MFCPGCGTNLPEGSGFCNVCGRPTTPTNVVSSAPIEQAPLPPPTTSGKSIASLIFGFFSFLFPAAIVAIVLGHLSLSEIGKSAGRIQGKGMAITGLVFGYLGISLIPILIMAAIAIPNLLRARMAANEASAVAGIRTLNVAEVTYAAAHPSTGYTCSLSELNTQADSRLATGENHGYAFEIANCTPDPTSGAIVKYQVAAHPLQHNTTGMRAFCSDESAVIRVDAGGSAQNCLENGPVLR